MPAATYTLPIEQGADFKVQASNDNTNWTDLASVTLNSLQTITVPLTS